MVDPDDPDSIDKKDVSGYPRDSLATDSEGSPGVVCCEVDMLYGRDGAIERETAGALRSVRGIKCFQSGTKDRGAVLDNMSYDEIRARSLIGPLIGPL